MIKSKLNINTLNIKYPVDIYFQEEESKYYLIQKIEKTLNFLFFKRKYTKTYLVGEVADICHDYGYTSSRDFNFIIYNVLKFDSIEEAELHYRKAKGNLEYKVTVE